VDAPASNQDEARAEAVRRVRGRLQTEGAADWAGQEPLTVTLLGRAFRVSTPDFGVTTGGGDCPHPVDEMLVLRRLESPPAVAPTGEMVPFRALPGGAFYHGVLAKRTTDRLTDVIGNDLGRLRAALAFLPHEETGPGDLGVRFEAVSGIAAALVYRVGDDEFPPAADLLYDRAIARVYTLDETAALATRLCGLLCARR
jgi:hypothetical protein